MATTIIEQLTGIRDGIVGALNEFLISAFPERTWIIVLLFSILIGWFFKKRYSIGNVEFALLTFMVFATFRYLGIGGV
jgi:hypothetical protein|tara:strand:- start:17891 stop:18124 length:234 start_codon:yes stop_codon:yes gene_type:complete